MATTEPDIVTQKAAAEILQLFREDQPTGFIALELTVSSRVLDAVKPGTKLAYAIDESAKRIPKQGFEWLGASPLERIVDLTRIELERAAEPTKRQELIIELLQGDPQYLLRLQLPHA